MQIFEQKYITKMIYLYTLQNTIFQRTLFWLGYAERCMQRSCVVCPQADVICTCGALDVAEPRWLVYVVAQRAECCYSCYSCASRTSSTRGAAGFSRGRNRES